MSDRHGIHAEILIVGGETYPVRRDFALICRLEELFGPLGDMLREIEKMRMPVARLADIYAALLPGVARHAIEAHILQVGVARAMTPVAALLMNLFVGDERLEERLAAEREAVPPDPRPAALSPGAT